jgi:exopolysaccharide production protein ExoQ
VSGAEGSSTTWLSGLVASALFARAYTLTVFGAVFASFAIERVAGRVTYVTIVVGLCAVGAVMLAARRGELSFVRLVPTTLVLFLAWTLVSVFWSSDRGASVMFFVSFWRCRWESRSWRASCSICP